MHRVTMENTRFGIIDGDELYRQLALGHSVVVLDVRTEPEFAEQHIPGSVLIPLQSLEVRIGEVPRDGVPIAVVCAHGQRSLNACRLLAEFGYERVSSLDGGLSAWPGPLTSGFGQNGHPHGLAPSSFLIENFDRLPRGLALDLAMGEGRNAIYLSTRGFDVDGVDADADRVARARVAARKLGAPIRAMVGNVEDGTWTIPPDTYDAVVVFNYLHRPLFVDIKEGVKTGGVVVYQTYTTEQARVGRRPKNPDYLLRAGELQEIFSDWKVEAYREFVGPSRRGGPARAVAGIVARRPL